MVTRSPAAVVVAVVVGRTAVAAASTRAGPGGEMGSTVAVVAVVETSCAEKQLIAVKKNWGVDAGVASVVVTLVMIGTTA